MSSHEGLVIAVRLVCDLYMLTLHLVTCVLRYSLVGVSCHSSSHNMIHSSLYIVMQGPNELENDGEKGVLSVTTSEPEEEGENEETQSSAVTTSQPEEGENKETRSSSENPSIQKVLERNKHLTLKLTHTQTHTHTHRERETQTHSHRLFFLAASLSADSTTMVYSSSAIPSNALSSCFPQTRASAIPSSERCAITFNST